MLEITLTAEKVTKNTVRYRELHPEPPDLNPDYTPVFPVIYIQKEALKLLGDARPETIKVTLEVV